jgi:tetratricopeptide (TPR) repeat protein
MPRLMRLILILAAVWSGAIFPSEIGAPLGVTSQVVAATSGTAASAENKQEASHPFLDFLKALLTSWAFVAIAALVVFYKPIIGLIEALAAAMPDGGINVDVGSVKVQIAERSFDTIEDRRVHFSITPFDPEPVPVAEQLSIFFEVSGGPSPDGATTTVDFPSQLTFQVSDYIGGRWVTNHSAEKKQLEKIRKALTNAVGAGVSLSSVRKEVVQFVRATEKCRSFEARWFAEFLEAHTQLRADIMALTPQDLTTNADDFLILHIAGIAYAQLGVWASGKQLLDKIALKDGKPWYLPSGDIWLACAYHNYIDKSAAADVKGKIDSYLQELCSETDQLLKTGMEFETATKDLGLWKTMPSSQSNIGYYKREILKVIGNMAAIVGDYWDEPAKKESYFKLAERMLTESNKEFDGDPPSPLDRNNLADLYRQMGRYDEAHAQINEALREGAQSPDPAFVNTQAWIFWKQGEPVKALRALQQYSEAQAKAGDPQDVDQYLDNQILAAKLAVSVKNGPGPARFAQAAELLEEARRFFEAQDSKRLDEEGDRIRAEIDELLGFTYLALLDNELQAAEAFDRLQGHDSAAPTVVQWRRKLGHATALIRFARANRLSFSSTAALRQRDWAATFLADGEARLKAFSLRGSIPSRGRIRHFRLHLDTCSVIHELARETFHEGLVKAAQTILEREEAIIAELRQVLYDDVAFKHSLKISGSSIPSQIEAADAQLHFLLGRISLESNPGFNDAELLANAEKNFNAARGITPELECQIDLAMGRMFLSAAQTSREGAEILYRRAVSSFERATTHNVPKLQSVTLIELADAYARQPSLLRRKKKIQKGDATS